MGLSPSLFAFMRFLLSLSLFYLIFPALQLLCHDDESFALLKFKESFTIDCSRSDDPSAYSKVSLWKLESGDCCKWRGVKCNEDTGHVISLDLNSSCLYGSINSTSSLFQLVHLHSLNLADNDFNSSRIPTGFRRLSRLTNLNLSDSVFFGQITSKILELSNLISLDLSLNSLKLQKHGLRSIAHKLTNLKELHLDQVDISSTVPNILANLSSLTSLFLDQCGLHGEFPTVIFHLPNLRSLDVGYNTYLSGSLPEFNRSSPLESLMLSQTKFSGEIPDSIGNLKSLYYFSAEVCNFFGPIPSSLGNLTQLIMLRLALNMVHGEFPTGIFHLPNLRSLDVEFNKNLTGSMPEFNRSSPLESLGLSKMSFSCELPGSIGNLKSLYNLRVEECNVFGPIPSSLGNLTQLIMLRLPLNMLHGSIPKSISRLVNLEILSLYSNHLSSTIPQSISRLVNLESLDLSSNNLSGTIPQSISRLVNLEYLDLSSNSLSGTIPQSISKLVNLEDLDLSSNHLSGTLEFDLFVKLKNYSSLRLSNNNISLLTKPSTNATLPKFVILMLGSCDLSEFPDFLSNQDELETLDLSQNKIHGQIPNWMCNLSSIVALDLSSNSLSGLLPQCLGNLSELLNVLNLCNNNFHGTIPEIFAKGNKLEMIDFSQNQFHGSLPRSLANCTMLEVLNLGNNQMNDTFPSWLGILPVLKVLILRSNGIYGAMGNPNSNFDFSNIRIIDLSHNDITGKLPSQYFKNWKAMRIVDVKDLMYMEAFPYVRYTYSMKFINKGTEIAYERIIDVFIAIDLSSNRFEGEIPEVVGHLKGLKVLNLSNNFLTGPIPSCFGNLTKLESLDLSQNNLAGVIPLQLMQLTFLESFNVSHNHLTGPIPQGNQFNTFPNSSFSNNPELCGSPLSKKCGNSKDPLSTFEENQNSESLFEFSWKVVVMGYGCGFMVGLVVGQILIKKNHDWLMKTFAIGQSTPRRVNQRGQRNSI